MGQMEGDKSLNFVKALSGYLVSTKKLADKDEENVDFSYLDESVTSTMTSDEILNSKKNTFQGEAETAVQAFFRTYKDASNWICEDQAETITFTLTFEQKQ